MNKEIKNPIHFKMTDDELREMVELRSQRYEKWGSELDREIMEECEEILKNRRGAK